MQDRDRMRRCTGNPFPSKDRIHRQSNGHAWFKVSTPPSHTSRHTSTFDAIQGLNLRETIKREAVRTWQGRRVGHGDALFVRVGYHEMWSDQA